VEYHPAHEYSVVVATGSECIVVKGEFIGGEIKTGCTDGLWNV